MAPSNTLRLRKDFLEASGVLIVVREPLPAPPPIKGQPAAVGANPAEGQEVLLSVWSDGRIIALHGHVDLGTGLRTALGQIVAEELDVSMDHVEVILGDTGRAPNQGPTIASGSIQLHSPPLRQAAAQARRWLLQAAASRWNAHIDALRTERGEVLYEKDGHTTVRATYAELIGEANIRLLLDPFVGLKAEEDHHTIGQPIPRVDIPGKATGQLTFVHDMRVPGMLHGRVVRPPYAGADHGDFVGNLLESVDETSIAHIPGIKAVVVIRDFIGIVAEREELAEQAASQLRVVWKDWPGLPDLSNLENALRSNPSTPRELINEGNIDTALQDGGTEISRTYIWPYQMHASIGPSCAIADWSNAEPYKLTVWAGTQNPHVLRADLARLAGLTDLDIEIVRMEASGCYGRNGADDVAADAVLLSRAVGAPVRVQLTREQENLWEPKGAAQWMQVRGGLDAAGDFAAYDFQTSYPSNGAPTLALLLTRTIEPLAQTYEMGDRTARPPYQVGNLRVTVNDMPPILRASWLRGVSALPNSFAHESYIDELATQAGVDPVEFRLRYLDDPRARELLQATTDKAGWLRHTEPQQQRTDGDMLRGQGVAYARYIHSKWPGFGAAWAAWVADVEVNRRTGEVHVKRVVVGHDAGMTINPAGVEHQVHGNVVQTTSRAIHESVPVRKQDNTVATREWGSYPILNFRQVPVIDVLQMPRPNEAPLGAGESSSVPGTAAIANAIFDATGVRFRQPPFTPEVVRAALNPLPPASQASYPAEQSIPLTLPAALNPSARWPTRRPFAMRLAAVLAGIAGLSLSWIGLRGPAPIAPITQFNPTLYSAQTIEKGRQLVALGNCVTCHTAPGGQPNAGGLGIQTPFGTVYSTNLTPDKDTGIGAWSLPAFRRAMRDGVSRDGHLLYPAFPYTSFKNMTDEDIASIYAYLMVQEPIAQNNPQTQLSAPFSYRPLMAVWNALYSEPATSQTLLFDQGELWNRGAYLVNGVGHCTACHTPRDMLGGEKLGQSFLSGAWIKGWEAPALTAASKSPVRWTEQSFYYYLRTGFSGQHGSAGGPMAPVVQQLASVPDSDIKAMAHYLASFQEPATLAQATHAAQDYVVAARTSSATLLGSAQRMFTMACAACHHDGDGPKLLGANVPLALNTNLHSDKPDNVIRVILEGVRKPASQAIGFMPSFAGQLEDDQVSALVQYMRARFAPDKAAWNNLEQSIARIRQEPASQTELTTPVK
ncbi:MAG: molybdopterin cofactor-binding domain-containing protein [Betaproteobacteria bacterium]